MATIQILTVDEVREYLGDYAQNNRLIEGEEFSDTRVSLCMGLAVDEYNTNPPFTVYSTADFPSKSILLWGTLWKMFEGKAAEFARNTLSYSDGGVQIPIEEKAELYKTLANGFHQNFNDQMRILKTHVNMESGWGDVRGDASLFPIW
jgi:hypothetical protein